MGICRHLALFVTIVSLAGNQPRATAQASSDGVAVAPQYDTTHVYVSPDQVDAFVKSFLGTFGGTSTPQVVATVTPTPSSTTSQLLQTPVGTVSVFGFKTPIPAPFGTERTGYLVRDMDIAVQQARAAGAAVIVAPFPDPIGRDAVIQWPGGVNMQLYWHTKTPSYAAFEHVPENRVYVSPDSANAFIRSFIAFSHGKIVSDESQAPGLGIGMPSETVHRIRIESMFGKMSIFVTDGFLPFPYGLETTGYEVDHLDRTLAKASSLGVTVLVASHTVGHQRSAMVKFPGGYIAELHEIAR